MPFVFSINLPVDIELSWFWGYISCGKFQNHIYKNRIIKTDKLSPEPPLWPVLFICLNYFLGLLFEIPLKDFGKFL